MTCCRPPKQALFRRLSVFAGGCTLAAVEALCADGATAAPGLSRDEVLAGLSALVEQSLLRIEEQDDGEPRFGMLETVREYGLEHLALHGEEEAVRRAYAQCYLDLAAAAEPALTGADQGLWLARLEREHANLQAVLAWAEAGGDPALGLHLVASLWRFWYLSEGRAWGERFLARSGTDDGAAAARWRGRALAGTAGLAYRQGDYGTAVALAEEGAALCRRLGDGAGEVAGLRVVAVVARDQGDLARAMRTQEEILALCRAADDPYGIAVTLHNLGQLARDQGDYARARALYEESLAIKQARGDPAGLAITLQNLGDVAWALGDLERAAALSEASLDAARRVGDKTAMAYALNGLGTVALTRADHERARACYAESLALRQEIGDSVGVAGALINLGHVARGRGEDALAEDHYRASLALGATTGLDLAECLQGLAEVRARGGALERAAWLLGVTDGVYVAAAGLVPAPAVRADYERITALIRQQAGEAAFAAAWAAGHTRPLARALAETIGAAAAGDGDGDTPTPA